MGLDEMSALWHTNISHGSLIILEPEIFVRLFGEPLLGNHQCSESFASHVSTFFIQPLCKRDRSFISKMPTIKPGNMNTRTSRYIEQCDSSPHRHLFDKRWFHCSIYLEQLYPYVSIRWWMGTLVVLRTHVCHLMKWHADEFLEYHGRLKRHLFVQSTWQ